MRPPQRESRNTIQLDTSKEFFDATWGWIRRSADSCPKCKRERTVAIFEAQGFQGCTYCLYLEELPGWKLLEGSYAEARKALETIFDETGVIKPIQRRFQPLNMRRDF